MSDTNRLLREYVDEGSENAFRELVERYMDLVFSVALRRAKGDAHLAEDIVQRVFTDLARKAAGLPEKVMLGGWLHRHCCFVAGTMHRTEARRMVRERQAMDLMTGGDESSWNELAPLMDEAIQDLQEPDREVLVMRYFERRDLRSVGVALGTSDDAAQKRVSRALERLRELLAARGATLSVAGLGGYMLSHSVEAAPHGVVARVGDVALSEVAKLGKGSAKVLRGSMGGGVGGMLGTSALKFGTGVAALVLITGLFFWKQQKPDVTTLESVQHSETVHANSALSGESDATVLAAASTEEREAGDDPNSLRVELRSKETGLPISGGRMEYRAWEGDKFSKRELFSDENGVVKMTIARASLTDLELTTRIEGLADTRLKWRPKRGDKIPSTYTLELEKAVMIGGTVVDPSGKGVAGAKVGFNHDEDLERSMATESHEFSWIEVETDSAGRWQMNRMADEMVRRLRGGAKHLEYVNSTYLEVWEGGTAEAELREKRHVFQLGTGAVVRGVVVNEFGIEIPGTKVLVGQRGNTSSRSAVSDLDGTFEIKGCTPGKSALTAEAPNYAATTIEIDTMASELHRIVLAGGKTLRMRVVNRGGEPVVKANVWLNTMEHRPTQGKALVQAEFTPLTDEEGRVFWDQAPDRELTFDIQGKGYMRASGVKVRPDGTEQVVTLDPGLKMSGTVVDAKTGQPIPKFKVIAGWPNREPGSDEVRPSWSPIERYWLSFSNGKFEHVWDEPVLYGMKEVEYVFKIEAEGYAAFVSRAVKASEENVRIDARLVPASSSTVTVLTAGGEPAGDAEVAFATAQDYVALGANGFSRSHGGTRIQITDQKGQFRFSPDESIARLYVAHKSGFAEIVPSSLGEGSVIRLQAWGRIEGRFTKRGRGLVGESMLLDPISFEHSQPRINMAPHVKTDAEGRFTFPQVPPGKIQLSYLVPQPGEGRTSTHMPLEAVEVRAGEATVVNYDQAGSEVFVRVEWPAEIPREPDQMIMAMARTPFPSPPAEVMGNPEAMRAWRMQPEIQALAAEVKHFRLQEDRNGIWKADDVKPGAYSIGVSVLKPGKNGEMGRTVLIGTKQLVIAEGAEERIDGGIIMLEPPKVLNAGGIAH